MMLRLDFSDLLAPAGSPCPVIDRLNSEIVRTLRDPQVAERLAAQGVEITPSTPRAFDDRLKAHAVSGRG